MSEPFPVTAKHRSLRIARLVLAAGCLVFLVYTLANPAAQAAQQLSQLAGARIHDWGAFEQALHTPGSGREQVAEGINQILDIFKHKHIAAFHLAPELRSNDFLIQRLEEGAWPIPYDENASFGIGQGQNP